MLVVLLLAACASSPAHKPPAHVGTHLMMDAYGHILAVPDSQAKSSPPAPPVTSKKRASERATVLNTADYIPLEEYEKQQAAKQEQQQHFYVLPVGQGVAGETVLTSTHKTQTKQPMLPTQDAWQNDSGLDACVDKQPILHRELESFAHWPASAYTTIKPGVSIHLVPDDLHALSGGRVVVGLRYPKHKQAWHWKLYGFAPTVADHCIFNPRVVMMDVQGHVLAEQKGVFTQYRHGSRIAYPGWRGELNSLPTAEFMFLVFTWPSTLSVPQFMVSDE